MSGEAILLEENMNSPAVTIKNITERFAKSNLHLSIRKNGSCFSSHNDCSTDVRTRQSDVGCIQTVLEGLVVYHLSQSELIDPDASLSEYLSEFSPRGHVGRDIRVAHLMSHSTGFHAPPNFFQGGGFGSWDELVEFFGTTQACFLPGSVSSLNALSRNLLHGLLQRVTGKTVYELVQEYIFAPNSMVASYANIETGWPMLLISTEELSRIPNIFLGDVSLGASLTEALAADTLKVVRGVRAPRASTPVGYAWGVGLFSDDTWGLNSNMAPSAAGFRFSGDENFSIALSMSGNPLARDLVMQYLATSLKENVPNPSAGLMGSLVDCRAGEVAGVYTADTPDVAVVKTQGRLINISITKDSSALVEFQLTVEEDGRVWGTGRWDTIQIEFFRRPGMGDICLLIGQIVYVKLNDI